MGMIESIRNRQTLLLTLIGLGMLSFLIPHDAVIALMGNTATSQAAGSVNGEEISFLEYRTKVQERNGLFNYTDNRAAQNEVWADIVSERLYGDEFEDLGLALTKEEFDDIRYGDFVSPGLPNVLRRTGQRAEEGRVAPELQQHVQQPRRPQELRGVCRHHLAEAHAREVRRSGQGRSRRQHPRGQARIPPRRREGGFPPCPQAVHVHPGHRGRGHRPGHPQLLCCTQGRRPIRPARRP